MPRKSKKQPSFESSLTDLESLVQQMEQGDISLEDSLKLFEQGITLTRDCQTALKDAEQKVSILLEKTHTADVEDFDNHA